MCYGKLFSVHLTSFLGGLLHLLSLIVPSVSGCNFFVCLFCLVFMWDNPIEACTEVSRYRLYHAILFFPLILKVVISPFIIL